MRTMAIRKKIETATAHERMTNAMHNHLAGEVRTRNLTVDEAGIRDIVQGLTVYISNVPLFLDAGRAAAQQAGVFAQIEPLFVRAEHYFIEPNDAIPDHVGLAGLLDDAYLTMAFLSAASERCAQQLGTPLFNFTQDLVNAHANVRNLLGDPIARPLDEYVFKSAVELYQATIMSAVQSALPLIMQSQSQGPPLKYVDPLGGKSPTEYANAMVSAYGI